MKEISLEEYLKSSVKSLTTAIDMFREVDPEGEDLVTRLIVGSLCRARCEINDAARTAMAFNMKIGGESKEEITFTEEQVTEIINDLEKVKETLKECANELCYRCGRYKNAHLGSCDGCKWKH